MRVDAGGQCGNLKGFSQFAFSRHAWVRRRSRKGGGRSRKEERRVLLPMWYWRARQVEARMHTNRKDASAVNWWGRTTVIHDSAGVSRMSNAKPAGIRQRGPKKRQGRKLYESRGNLTLKLILVILSDRGWICNVNNGRRVLISMSFEWQQKIIHQ